MADRTAIKTYNTDNFIVKMVDNGDGTFSEKVGATLTGGGDASAANQTTIITEVGATNETAPASDIASSGLNGRLQRIAQRLTSLIALLPTSLGQKTMANSLAVAVASDQSSLFTKPETVTWSAPAAVSVTTTATQIKATNSSRKRITITNDSANILYIGLDNTVTSSGTTKGLAIAANGGGFTTNHTGAIYGIYGTGSNTVSYIEET